MARLGVGGLASFIGDSRQSLQGQFAMSCQGKSPHCLFFVRKTGGNGGLNHFPGQIDGRKYTQRKKRICNIIWGKIDELLLLFIALGQQNKSTYPLKKYNKTEFDHLVLSIKESSESLVSELRNQKFYSISTIINTILQWLEL